MPDTEFCAIQIRSLVASALGSSPYNDRKKEMTELTTPPATAGVGAAMPQPLNELNAAATELVLEHGAMIMREALEHSACAEDADDAYQRSLEILLTKAPSTDPKELVAWLRVVVRNEALDIARLRSRTPSEPFDTLNETAVAATATPYELLERSETASTGAEALERLNRDQVHCLLAYAHGHSYSEIAEITGFTARKVTRCVTDGRRAFTSRFAAIESGSECERLEPVLQRIADGDSFAHIEARPHLRNCAGCRATLRAYREAPARVAALFPLPLVAVAAAPAVEPLPGMLDQIGAIWGGAAERFNAQIYALQQWLEVGTAKKLGATAAAVAALTAGGVAVKHDGDTGQRPIESVAQTAVAPVRSTPPRLFDPIETPAQSESQPDGKRKSSKERRRESAPAETPPPQPVAPPPAQPSRPQGGTVSDGVGDLAP